MFEFIRIVLSLGPEFYRQFTRISENGFKFIVEKIRNRIEKQDTHYRDAISAEERLSVALKYLAAGDLYFTLCSLFRISKSAISLIIPEVCEAIYKELKDEYVKVKSCLYLNF